MDFRTRRQRRDEAELDMTPLIDVVFLLLIFFLVTATFAQHEAQSSVPVDLPEGATGEAAGPTERITVHLQADGTVTVEAVGADPVVANDLDALDSVLRQVRTDAEDAPVYLRGDRDVPYGRVMEVLDTARRVGFRQVYNVVYTSAE